MKHLKTMFCVLGLSLVVMSCEKDEHVPPNVSLKTGAGYTAADASVTAGTAVTVGFVAEKTEDELKTFNVSHAYDNAATTTTDTTFTLSGGEEEHFEKDYTFNTRSTAGSEKWIFTITDRDGNIAQKQIVLTVQ